MFRKNYHSEPRLLMKQDYALNENFLNPRHTIGYKPTQMRVSLREIQNYRAMLLDLHIL